MVYRLTSFCVIFRIDFNLFVNKGVSPFYCIRNQNSGENHIETDGTNSNEYKKELCLVFL